MIFPDERDFLAARQGFDLQFPPKRVSLGSDAFGIDQFHRAAGRGIGTASALVMDCDAPFDIIRDPRIKRIIPAADDITVIWSRFGSFLRNKPPKKSLCRFFEETGFLKWSAPALFF